jgi:serine/threonine protein kinase
MIDRYREPVEGMPFGRYQLIELLGRGGMGEVWRAHDTEIDRVVAIKMLLPHYAQDPDFEKRFMREARAAGRIDDPHIVPIYDVGEIDGRLYVTMRLIKGTDLQTLLDAGPLDPARAVHIIEQIASALHCAHQAGLVHRDVKPSNILLTDNDFASSTSASLAAPATQRSHRPTPPSAPGPTWPPNASAPAKPNPAPTSTRWPACSTNA